MNFVYENYTRFNRIQQVMGNMDIILEAEKFVNGESNELQTGRQK
jgi:hypothetical protein